MPLSLEFQEKLQKIKLFMVDVDGVMTDGRIVYGDHGDELKFFDVQDGFGLVMLTRAGLKTVMITAKRSRVNVRRAKEVKITKLYQGATDKLAVYEKILKKFRVSDAEVLYVGDDLIDLPVLKRAGFSAAVANALPEIKERTHYVTERPGGRGAIRELSDLLLKAQGKWSEAIARYSR